MRAQRGGVGRGGGSRRLAPALPWRDEDGVNRTEVAGVTVEVALVPRPFEMPAQFEVRIDGARVSPEAHARSCRGAMGLVEAAAVGAREPAHVAPRIRAEAERRAEHSVLREVVDRVTDLGDDAAHRLGPVTGRFAAGLAQLVAEAARLGFVLRPDGSVLEAWRERARGRWIPGAGIVDVEEAEPAGRVTELVRVEGECVLELVHEDGEWTAYRDGERLGAAHTAELAQALALAAARRGPAGTGTPRRRPPARRSARRRA